MDYRLLLEFEWQLVDAVMGSQSFGSEFLMEKK